jgi:hypothetical protein
MFRESECKIPHVVRAAAAAQAQRVQREPQLQAEVGQITDVLLSLVPPPAVLVDQGAPARPTRRGRAVAGEKVLDGCFCEQAQVRHGQTQDARERLFCSEIPELPIAKVIKSCLFACHNCHGDLSLQLSWLPVPPIVMATCPSNCHGYLSLQLSWLPVPPIVMATCPSPHPLAGGRRGAAAPCFYFFGDRARLAAPAAAAAGGGGADGGPAASSASTRAARSLMASTKRPAMLPYETLR